LGINIVCLNSLLKSVDFEHFWVNGELGPKFGFWEGRFFGLNSLLKSVDFKPFLVHRDRTPK